MYAPALQAVQQVIGLDEQWLELGVSDFVLAAYLPDDQLGIKMDAQGAASEADGGLQPGYQCSIFRDIVGAPAKIDGLGGDFPSVFVEQDHSGAGFAGIAA
ncbi:MAG: hypothetical protein RBR09_03765 [Desulfobulbaceae bacterium]|nr:hypothetical protein [Desulfobulbaceae bacterium]